METSKSNDASAAVLANLAETFETIGAVKGEKYVDTLKAILNVVGFSRIITAALAGQAPAEVGALMLMLLGKEFICRTCEANGTPFDDELQNWLSTIDKNTAHTAQLAMAGRGESPLQ